MNHELPPAERMTVIEPISVLVSDIPDLARVAKP